MKLEVAMVVIGLALAHEPVSQEAQQLRIEIIDYYCGHYKQLEQADDGEFNSSEVYAKIQQTCDSLRKIQKT
jgi:hypothetical protein